MVSPEATKLNELLRNAPKAVDMDLPHQREAGEHAEDMTSEPEGVLFEDAPAVGGLWATPRSWDGESAIMYLYGGGYVISSPHSRRKLAGHLANAARARALVPRYHLAPSAPSLRPSTTLRPTTGGCSGRGIIPSGSSSPGIRAPAASLSPRCSNCAMTVQHSPRAEFPFRLGSIWPVPERRSRRTPRRTSRRPRPACSAWRASTYKVRTRTLRSPRPFMQTCPVYRPSW